MRLCLYQSNNSLAVCFIIAFCFTWNTKPTVPCENRNSCTWNCVQRSTKSRLIESSGTFLFERKKNEVQQMGLVLSAVAFRNCFVREIQSLRRVGAAIACPGAYDYRDYPHFFSCFVFSVRDFFFVERVWVLDRPRNREKESERERERERETSWVR